MLPFPNSPTMDAERDSCLVTAYLHQLIPPLLAIGFALASHDVVEQIGCPIMNRASHFLTL